MLVWQQFSIYNPNTIELDTLAKLVSNPDDWTTTAAGFSSTLRYQYSSGALPGVAWQAAAPGVQLSRVRAFAGTFTCYVNTPANCLSYNIWRLSLSNGQSVYVGVMDQNADGAQPVHLYEGSLVATRPAGNIIDRRLSYRLPTGVWLTALDVCSASYVQYARGTHGFKDIVLSMV